MDVKAAMSVTNQPVPDPEAKGVSVRWLIGPDDKAPNFHMRQFEIAPGGHTPRHRHAWEHEVYVLGGAGKVYCEHGGEKTIRAGSVVFVRPNEEHQFLNDGWDKLTFLCLIPIEGCPVCKG